MKTISYHRRKFFFIPLGLAALALFTWITMLLWNALLPVIFNLSAITFWQALGLLALTRLLFGGMHSHSNWKKKWPDHSMDHELRSKILKMSPDERKEFFRKMKYNREAWYREFCGEKEQEKKEEKEELG